MKARLLGDWLGVTTVLFVACGGSTDNGGRPHGPVPQDQFAEQMASAICSNIGGCCAKAGYSYDAAQCTSALRGQLQAQFAGAKTSYDQSKAGECVDQAAKFAASCGGGTLGACDEVFNGSVADGGACKDQIDCAKPPGGRVSCTGGVCEQHLRGKAGDPCNSTCDESTSHSSCANFSPESGATCYVNDGLQCGASGTCEPLVKKGGACQSLGCVSGTYCEFSSATCVTTLATGSPCSDWDACAVGYCDSSGVCNVKLGEGASCSDSEQCLSDNCAAGHCAPALVTPEQCAGLTH